MIISLNNRPLYFWLLLISAISWCLLFTPSAQAAVSFVGAEENAIDMPPSLQTINFIGSGTSEGISGCGSITPTIPAGDAGDLLIATAMAKEDDGGNDVTMPGWNTYYTANYSDFSAVSDNNEMQVRIFWRFATGGDPNTITQSGSFCNFNGGSGTPGLGGQISRFRGVDPASPFETPAPGVVAQDSDFIDTGTITTNETTAMLLVATFISDDGVVTEGAGWTEAFDFDYNDGGSEPDLGISLNYQPQTTAGLKSISNWPHDKDDENIGAIFALTPGPATGNELTINLPAGTTEGNVMIASVTARPATIAITPPAGWTLIRQTIQPNAESSILATYYKMAGASEPAIYSFGLTSLGFTGAAGGIASFSGVNTASLPYDDEAGTATPSDTTHTAPDVTTTLADGMLVTIHEFTSSMAWTPPPGMTEAVNISSLLPNNAAGISMTINYEARPTAGATGTRSATVTGNADVGATQSVSLLPIPIPPPLAYYRMDEISWDGTADEVEDFSGNANHGVAVDGISTNSSSPAIPGSPGTCRYAEIPDNNSTNTTEAIDTNVNVTTDVGNAGTISLWFKSNEDWDGGENRQLIDASTTASGQKYFFLQVRDNSRLRFSLEDSNDGDFELETGDNNFLADQWVHIAITWDLPNDTMQIYINGSLAAEDTTFNTNGVLGGLDTIYLGDNRSSYFAAGSTRRSADGSIDEARIYNYVQTPAQIQADRGATHPCALGQLDRFDIIVPIYGSVCNANNSEITVTAKDFLGNTIEDYTGLINLSTSNGLGDWSLIIGNGTLDNGTADDGLATYQYVSLDQGIAKFDLAMSDDADVAITVQDIAAGITSTSAEIDFRRGSRSFLITTDPIQIAGRPQAMTIGRLANDCEIDTDYNNDREVEAWITRDIDDPNGIAPSINTVSLPNSRPGNDNLTGANQLDFINGIASFNLDTTDVGKYILNIRDGSRRGSSDTITTRPFGFAFTNIQNAGGTPKPNPPGTIAGDGGFVAAEENFSATIGAYLWHTDDDDNVTGGDGIPDTIDTELTDNGLTPAYDWDTALSAILHTPAPGTLGNLTPATVTIGAFASLPFPGEATVTNMNYDEAGSIVLQADATDFLNSPGVNITGTSRFDSSTGASAGVVGRFYPDHFTLISSTVTPANTTFTYMGQDLGITFELRAQGLANGLTTNYDDVTRGYAGTATFTTAAEDNNDGTALDLRITDPSPVQWNLGVFNYNNTAETFTRDAGGPDGPYLNLQLSLRVDTEMDGRTIENLDENTDEANNCVTDTNCTSIALDILTDIRFGRARLQNTFGSELVDQSIPLFVDYFSADGFITNAADSDTSYSALASGDDIQPATLSNPGGNLLLADTTESGAGSFNNGVADPLNPIMLSAPGIGNDGSLDISLDAPAYLEFDWDGDGNHDNDPVARVTFGIYRGNDSTIYFRELY